MTQVRLTRAASRDTQSVDFAESAFTETMNCTHTVETSTNVVTFAIGVMVLVSNNILSTMIHSKSTSEKTTSYVRIESVWRRSLWSSIQKWISKHIKSRHIPTVCPALRCEMRGG
jgi:hypothetical protein